MRALPPLGRLVNPGEGAEGARRHRDIGFDRFWDSHHGERVSPPLGLLKEFPGPALRTITADCEEDVDAAADQILHRPDFVHRTARSTQNGPALEMNSIH